MMNGPFFRNYLNQQPSRSSIPVQQKPSPKVISVPVHFVSSDQPRTTISMLKDSAAIKIQKLFRGFTVRKSVKKISSIRHEVSEIERRIDDIEAVNLIRGDAKERLRVNETLMSLLLKLDSIRGVDSGIRDLRKAVTKKAIALQEKVDSIASNSVDEIVNHEVNLEAVDCIEAAGVIGEVEGVETGSVLNSSEFGGKGSREIVEKLMDENEEMMRVMREISERNEAQTRMINALSRRVEELETAEKKRKKKANVPLRRRRDKDSLCVLSL